uniref:FHA domain-containing protein n=1 Tax=Oryza brachyantha TaxID=4533 RepID=J3NAZ5_ORYBR
MEATVALLFSSPSLGRPSSCLRSPPCSRRCSSHGARLQRSQLLVADRLSRNRDRKIGTSILRCSSSATDSASSSVFSERWVLEPAGDGEWRHIGYRVARPGGFQIASEAAVTVGRVPEQADIVLSVATVSGAHARLEKKEGRLLVTDLDSTNGTYINERRLTPGFPTPIDPGSLLIFGDIHLAMFRVSKMAIDVPSDTNGAEQEAEIAQPKPQEAIFLPAAASLQQQEVRIPCCKAAAASDSWAEFAARVSGEWDGFGAEFTAAGDPVELPEKVVPEAYREWGVQRHASSASAFAYSAGGSYVAAWPKGPAPVLEVEHCVVHPDNGEVRVRLVQTVALAKEARLRGVKVFSEQWYGPYRNGEQLGGCAVREAAFAAGEKLPVSDVIGQWHSNSAFAARFSNELDPETGKFAGLTPDEPAGEGLSRDDGDGIVTLPKQLWSLFKESGDGEEFVCEFLWQPIALRFIHRKAAGDLRLTVHLLLQLAEAASFTAVIKFAAEEFKTPRCHHVCCLLIGNRVCLEEL